MPRKAVGERIRRETNETRGPDEESIGVKARFANILERVRNVEGKE